MIVGMGKTIVAYYPMYIHALQCIFKRLFNLICAIFVFPMCSCSFHASVCRIVKFNLLIALLVGILFHSLLFYLVSQYVSLGHCILLFYSFIPVVVRFTCVISRPLILLAYMGSPHSYKLYYTLYCST